MVITRERIYEVYGQVESTAKALFQATEVENRAKESLEVAKLAAIASKQIEGRNETEREARARELLPAQYAQLTAAEAERRHARLAMDLAAVGVEALRMEMRLAELESQTNLAEIAF